jgi:DNA helicase-2/ATP-dependent DNA helicase PcrA
VLDEAQDSPQNQVRVFLKWAGKMSKAIVAGDPDQTLYSFAGARPSTMIDMPLAEGARHVLSQSYRVPGAVHEVAERWIRGANRRLDREYLPRVDADGKTVSGKFEASCRRFDRPEFLVDDAMKHVEAGQTVMFIASCSYLVDPIKHRLKQECIPFANPWRESRGDWNPLRLGKDATTFRRLLAFLRPSREFSGDTRNVWTWDDVYLWGEWLEAASFWNRGGKSWLTEKKGCSDPFEPRELMAYIRDEQLDAFEDLAFGTREDRARALDWWSARVARTHENTARYLVGVIKRCDVKVTEKPKIFTGTVHSFKGGEADVVYLCPELSKKGFQSWIKGGETQDSVRRMLYVGMTRAKEELILCDGDGQFSLRKAIIGSC